MLIKHTDLGFEIVLMKNKTSGIHNIGFAWIALKINRKYINIRSKRV
jgi:hypothetical protein